MEDACALGVGFVNEPVTEALSLGESLSVDVADALLDAERACWVGDCVTVIDP